MNIGWPEGIYLVLIAMGLGITLAKDGEPRGNFSFGTTLVATVMSLALLYWGGFFS